MKSMIINQAKKKKDHNFTPKTPGKPQPSSLNDPNPIYDLQNDFNEEAAEQIQIQQTTLINSMNDPLQHSKPLWGNLQSKSDENKPLNKKKKIEEYLGEKEDLQKLASKKVNKQIFEPLKDEGDSADKKKMLNPAKRID